MKQQRKEWRRRKPKPGKKEPGWQASPRQIRLGLLVGGAIVVTALGLVVAFSLPHRLKTQERILVQQYDSVRAALSLDDLPAARAAASALEASPRDHKRIREAAIALARAESLPAARDAFQAMSSQVIKLASGNDGYYRMGCSMAGCPAACEPCDTIKFGDWIQTSSAVQNPFMGKVHPNCGIVK